jgi:DNA processing protein
VVHTRTLSAAEAGLTEQRVFDLWGDLPPEPRLAIVGSRAAHRDFRDTVPALVAAAGRVGWSIVSGGALGIDGDAHRAALDMDVPQAAVLPCGPDLLYPPAHRDLFHRISRVPGSGLVFAHPRGTTPVRAMFASRNRIVVALSSAVLVVQAGVRSGTMVTGRLSLARRTPLAAVTGSPGAAMLVAEGAHALRPGPADADALAHALATWLDAVRDGRSTDASALQWPAHLVWLSAELQRKGPLGLCTDDLGERPGGLLALLEAEALGLVIELTPGRYLARG